MTNIITRPAWKVSDEYIRLRWIMFFIGEYFAINIFSMIKNISTSPIIYRVIGWKGPKVIAYCSKNMGSIALLSPPGAHQIWSI